MYKKLFLEQRILIMSTDLSLQSAGYNPLFAHKSGLAMTTLLAGRGLQPRPLPLPLPHSIEAILQKASSSSSSYAAFRTCARFPSPAPGPQPTLPHIETLRRCRAGGACHGFRLPLVYVSALTSGSLGAAGCPSTIDADEDVDVEDWRTSPSSGSSAGSPSGVSSCCSEQDEEDEEVDVVEDCVENSRACPTLERSTTNAQSGTANLPQHFHNSLAAKPSFQSARAELATPDRSQSTGRTSNNKLNAPCVRGVRGALEETTKSAFRPIVRPWLARHKDALAYQTCASSLRTRCRETLTAAAAAGHISRMINRGCPVPADVGRRTAVIEHALARPKTQGTAVRRPSGTATYPLELGRHYQLPPQAGSTPRALPSCVPARPDPQPQQQSLTVPSTLASWYSWLRSGCGLQPQPAAAGPGSPLTRSLTGPYFGPAAAGCQALPPPPTASARPPVAGGQHQHAVPHHNPPRYNCEACGKSYSTFGGLSKHKQFHCTAQVKKEFSCKYCEKSYTSLGALKMHIRTHTLPCKCSVCGKAFSRPWLLQGHVRTHTGEKPFSCQHCQRAFADRSNLRAHLQTHSHVKKYSCPLCHKTFSRMSLLLKHRHASCPALQR